MWDELSLWFSDRNDSKGYLPFMIQANERWNLAVECTQEPTPNAWTVLYVYERFWDEGIEHECVSEDLCPILSNIESSENHVNANTAFTEIFGEAADRSYTLFPIFSLNGEDAFHVTLTRMD